MNERQISINARHLAAIIFLVIWCFIISVYLGHALGESNKLERQVEIQNNPRIEIVNIEDGRIDDLIMRLELLEQKEHPCRRDKIITP